MNFEHILWRIFIFPLYDKLVIEFQLAFQHSEQADVQILLRKVNEFTDYLHIFIKGKTVFLWQYLQ